MRSAQRNEARGARRGLRGLTQRRAATRPTRPSSPCAHARRGRPTAPRHKSPPTSAGSGHAPRPLVSLTTPATSSTCRRFPCSARVSIREHSQDVTNHQPCACASSLPIQRHILLSIATTRRVSRGLACLGIGIVDALVARLLAPSRTRTATRTRTSHEDEDESLQEGDSQGRPLGHCAHDSSRSRAVPA